MIVGIYFALTLPKIYGANTLILVQPQKVPSNFVQSLVSVGINERISTIRQQILSRSNLEKIIEDFKLFSEPEHAKMYTEDKIESLRTRIAVNVTRARSGADAFSISFEGKNPERIMRIANSLASYFINENLKVREAQAIGTSDFLDDQLSSMRKRLVGLEEALKQYHTKHMGSLPEQLQTNLRILDRLQQQLDARQQSSGDTKNRLAALEQLLSEKPNAPVAGSSTADNRRVDSESEDSTDLEQLKEQLKALKARYTDKHPDVVRLKRTIAKLGGEIEKQTEEVTAEATLPEASKPDHTTMQKRRRDEINREIANQDAEISEIIKQIAIYQQRVEDTPKREQELLTLNRDYNNMQQAYSSLLGRKLEAEISVDMEKKQKGEQFRILDSAKLPEKPVSPDMKKIFALSLAAGLGVGGGIVFLFFYFDSSFRRPEEVESVLGVSVLATLPKVYQDKDIKKQRLNLILSLLSLAVSLALLAGFVLLTIKGVG